MFDSVIGFSILVVIGWIGWCIFAMGKRAGKNSVSNTSPTAVVTVSDDSGDINEGSDDILLSIGITYSEDPRYKINYIDGFGDKSERIIRPIKIMREPCGEFYIDAYCELRNDMRTFRSSRIEHPIVDIETGEVVNLENLPFMQVFEGARGGRYVVNDNGKKRYL
jgi:predicted DNA-binding transcriptional regulator YafY